jgi:hypothetical protein
MNWLWRYRMKSFVLSIFLLISAMAMTAVSVSAREWKVGDKGYWVAGTTIVIIQAITSVTNPVQWANAEEFASPILNALTLLLMDLKQEFVPCLIALPTERIWATTGNQGGLVVTFPVVSIGADKQLIYL